MRNRRRGALAALFLTAAVGVTALTASAGPLALAPGESVLNSGLTTLVRQTTGPSSVAIEVWIRCPANGWDASEPGIARLTAFAAVSAKTNGASLRDLVQADGAELSVSVFQTATEIAVLAPANAAGDLQDAVVRSVFGASIDEPAFDDAKSRLAEQQALV